MHALCAPCFTIHQSVFLAYHTNDTKNYLESFKKEVKATKATKDTGKERILNTHTSPFWAKSGPNQDSQT